jgi:peptide/nickel transport system substrate-binding protein
MRRSSLTTVMAITLLGALLAWSTAPAMAETPQRGGILTFVVPAEPPSFDGHRESTFALIHPIAPFYSVLIRVNPENPASPTDFVGDIALEVPAPTDGGKKYTFKLRKNVKFWDGQPLTAADVVASFRKIIFPPKGVASARKAFFSMVDKVYATDDYTVVFELKYPSSAFIPALATPFNFIYSAKRLAQDMHWYEKNILGSGPFIFKERQPGAFIEGRRNPNYHHAGLPYLDGFRAIFAKKQSLRVQAVRGGRAMVEFRGFPPKSRDDLKRALGDEITVQESDWNCALLVTPNHLVKPFDDPRVRRALTLAIDRWGGSKYLSRIAIVKTVGGVVFPNHPLAASREELQQLAGYWPDLEKSRAEARRLLREAGVPEGFKFRLHNRGVDQPYKIVGTWLVDQWRNIGLNVKQWVQPTGPFYKTLRSHTTEFEVSIDFNCQAVVNPLIDVSKYISDDRAGNNYANYKDRVLDDLFDRMNRTTDVAEQKRLMRQFEKRVLDEQAHTFVTLWWYRIIPHRSVMRGWKISPSHYLNQDLSTVWLAQKPR